MFTGSDEFGGRHIYPKADGWGGQHPESSTLGTSHFLLDSWHFSELEENLGHQLGQTTNGIWKPRFLCLSFLICQRSDTPCACVRVVMEVKVNA